MSGRKGSRRPKPKPGTRGKPGPGASRVAAQPTRAFTGPAALERWLEKHHARSEGLWIRIAKAGTGVASVTYAEALEVALCWGWIDGLRQKHDERFFRQRFTPRRARSIWSKINKARAEALIAAGRMRAPGHAAIAAARSDGRWDAAYAGQRSATVPHDLQAALDAEPGAKRFFATLDRVNRYAVIFRVQTAARPETLARRIATFVAMLARGEKLHP